MKKVMVTERAGFIGSHLVDKLFVTHCQNYCFAEKIAFWW